MQYKFVQIADVCFNHSMSSDTQINKLIEDIRVQSFNKTIDLCIKEKVTALLICGNLFDESNITLSTVQVLKKSFDRLRANNIAIVYAHGKLDKGALVKNLKKEVFDFGTGYTSTSYDLAYDLDRVNFVGLGYSKMLMLEDEFMDAGGGSDLSIGLVYIDTDVYTKTMRETIHKRLNNSNADYWALGGQSTYRAYQKNSKHCYSGSLAAIDQSETGCTLVKINHKKKITTTFVRTSDYVHKKLSIVVNEEQQDIYKLVEDCVVTILDNKDLKRKNIVELDISGPCKCYNSLVNHIDELKKEIARLTDVSLSISVKNLFRSYDVTQALREETDINQLLDQCNTLFENDEMFNRLIHSLQARGALFLEKEEIDKHSLMQGIDSLLIESRQNKE